MVAYKSIVEAFFKKLKFKGHTSSLVDQLLNADNDKAIKPAWVNSIRYQIAGELPDYSYVFFQLI
jgi:hypothetical protein